MEELKNAVNREWISERIRMLGKDNGKGNGAAVSETAVSRALDAVRYLYVDGGILPEIGAGKEGTVSIAYAGDALHIAIKFADDSISVLRHGGKSSMHNVYSYGDGIKAVCEFVGMTKLFFNEKTDRICLFSGSFNPPTIAHRHMAVSACDKGNFNYVVIAAANSGFLDKKQNGSKGIVYSENERLGMLLIMTRDYPDIIIFGIETGYTYNVLCAVRDKYNAGEVYFACGSDKLSEIRRWGNNEQLLSEFCFYIRQRDDDMDDIVAKCENLFSNTKYLVRADNKYGDISSTQVRNAISAGSDFGYLVTPEVYDEIMKINEGRLKKEAE